MTSSLPAAASGGALGRAEVSLTIDNADHRIPVEFSEVTLTRTLFRTGESEYAINGVQCRLLDIQELLSDSGVGRQQHVIVSQGNLDAVLAARPEDRRMIIEEAAGVLKFRKRREKSQRRLEATEQNLERLQDLVREVRQQLRPLQKQAEAAMRHGDVVSELRNLQLFTTGRDIDALTHRLTNAEAETAGSNERTAELRDELTAADHTVGNAEVELTQIASRDVGDQVERLEGLFERARGHRAVMVERRRTLESELSAQVSKDVVAQLEHDAASVRRDLETVSVERDGMIEPFEGVVVAEQKMASEWLDFEQEWGEGLPVATNEAAEIRGEAASLRKNVDGLRQELERRRSRLSSLQQQIETIGTQRETGAADEHALLERRPSLDEAVTATVAALQTAETVLEAADLAHRDADQRASAANARVEALSDALDASRARAGVERLGELDGIAGTLVELVDVDDGYQAAFEAAAGEALAAVVVHSPSAARTALRRLRDGDGGGAVLVLGQAAVTPGGVPEGATGDALRAHVRGSTLEIDELLDRVLCCCVVADGNWEAAVDLTIDHPDIIAVTRDGDRFSRNGWRIGTGAQGATAAAVEAAAQIAATATVDAAEKAAAFEARRTERTDAATAARDAERAVNDNERKTADAAALVERLDGRRTGLDDEIDTIQSQVTTATERVTDEEERLSEIEIRLPALEAAEASGEERARLWREARGLLEEKSNAVRNNRREVEVQANSLEERHTYLSSRLESLEQRLERHRVEVEEAAERRERIWAKMAVLDNLAALAERLQQKVQERLVVVREARDQFRSEQRAVSESLENARRRRSTIERELLDIAERRQQHEVRQAEIRLRLEALTDVLERELETTLAAALGVDEPELEGNKTPKQRITELERDVRQMGPINPLALEEFETVKERHEFLDKQLQDVQESRRELARVIRSVDAEIVSVFNEAFVDVARNFEDLFAALFPGGTGRLKLTDPENPLETGIEVEAKPSGKNVRTLSLLSGGERSLVALGFLFAVFRSRPSPFYLLDEVEAALDDMNLTRFLRLLDEFRDEAQLVIVSHQKRTMEKADCLYGVSMQPGGSTKVISERVEIESTIDLRDSASSPASVS